MKTLVLDTVYTEAEGAALVTLFTGGKIQPMIIAPTFDPATGHLIGGRPSVSFAATALGTIADTGTAAGSVVAQATFTNIAQPTPTPEVIVGFELIDSGLATPYSYTAFDKPFTVVAGKPAQLSLRPQLLIQGGSPVTLDQSAAALTQ